MSICEFNRSSYTMVRDRLFWGAFRSDLPYLGGTQIAKVQKICCRVFGDISPFSCNYLAIWLIPCIWIVMTSEISYCSAKNSNSFLFAVAQRFCQSLWPPGEPVSLWACLRHSQTPIFRKFSLTSSFRKSSSGLKMPRVNKSE